jgi:hypothetical protein
MQTEYLLSSEKPRESITKKVIIGALVGTAAIVGYANYHGASTTATPTNLVAPNAWGKQDYINFQWKCYAKGDSSASGSYDYKSSWNTAVNQCLYGVHGTGSGSISNVPKQWGKSDYENYIWGCFANGDSSAAGSYNYHDAWNNAVNDCMASMFLQRNAMAFVASSAWGKQDYINYNWACYA